MTDYIFTKFEKKGQGGAHLVECLLLTTATLRISEDIFHSLGSPKYIEVLGDVNNKAIKLQPSDIDKENFKVLRQLKSRARFISSVQLIKQMPHGKYVRHGDLPNIFILQEP